jgi:hypothetical protein
MITATVYEKEQGQVLMTVEAPDEETVHLQIQNPSKEEILWGEKIDGQLFYFVAGSVVPRPVFPLEIKNGLTVATGQVIRISKIPIGCTVRYPGGTAVVNDGYIEWSSVTAGTFDFSFSLFPYQEMSLNAIVR